MLGFSSTEIETSSKESAQVPFEMVQRKMLVPAGKPETAVVEEVASVNEAEPEMTVQSPVPMSGVLAVRTDVVAQIF